MRAQFRAFILVFPPRDAPSPEAPHPHALLSALSPPLLADADRRSSVAVVRVVVANNDDKHAWRRLAAIVINVVVREDTLRSSVRQGKEKRAHLHLAKKSVNAYDGVSCWSRAHRAKTEKAIANEPDKGVGGEGAGLLGLCE